MSDDERVVRSFVAADEAVRGTWTVTRIERSKGRLPPGGAGEQTVAVTDRRVLWFADELAERALDSIDEIEREHVERQAAPPIVLAGGLVFVLGVFGSVGAFFADVGHLVVIAMPALTGLLAFFTTRFFATATGREGETRAGHRLTLWSGGEPVTIWSATETPLVAIEGAIGHDDGSLGGSGAEEETATVDGDVSDDGALDAESESPSSAENESS